MIVVRVARAPEPWLLVARGLVAIILGVIGIGWPSLTLELLVMTFGLYALVSGAAGIATAILRGDELRAWHIVDGIAGLIAGVVVFTFPTETAIVLGIVVALWAILAGTVGVVVALRSRSPWLAVAGVAIALSGALMLVAPDVSAVALMWLIAVGLIVHGAVLTVVGFELRASWRAR